MAVRLLTFARKNPVMLLLIPGLVIFLVNFLAGHRGISGNDANYYFAQAGAIASCRSLGAVETYEVLAAQGGANWSAQQMAARTSTGWFYNLYPIGHPMLHVPGVLAGAALGWIGGQGWDPLGPFAQAGFCVSAILAAALGLALMRAALSRWFGEDAILFALVAMTAGTPLGYYWFIQPAMSHTSSLLMAGIICWSFVRITEAGAGPWHWALLGGALGWNVAVRNQDVAFVCIGIAALVLAAKSARPAAGIIPLIAATIVAVIPQLIVYYLRDGSILPRQYSDYSSFDWAHPHFIAVLFSPRHGLFLWHPLLLAAAVGVLLSLRRRSAAPTCTIPWLLTFLGLWFISAAFSIWWFGDSFGSRPFLSVTPLFLLGFCEIWQRAPRRAVRVVILAIVAIAVCWNALLAVAYHASWISRSEPLDVPALFGRFSG